MLPSIFSFDVPEMKDGSTSSVVDHNNCKCFGDIPNLCLHFGTVIRVSCSIWWRDVSHLCCARLVYFSYICPFNPIPNLIAEQMTYNFRSRDINKTSQDFLGNHSKTFSEPPCNLKMNIQTKCSLPFSERLKKAQFYQAVKLWFPPKNQWKTKNVCSHNFQ